MLHSKHILTTILGGFLTIGLSAQVRVAGHTIHSNNFYQIRDSIEQNLRQPLTGIPQTEQEENGDEFLNRWEDYWQFRVNDDGSFPAPNVMQTAMADYARTHPNTARSARSNPANWQPIIVHYPSNPEGIGRVDRIRFGHTNSSRLYLATPSGGLWETTNQGATWNVKTDNLPLIGLSDIAIDPTDSNVIYIATGDGEADQDNQTIGVLKSTDGGHTFNPTGLTYTQGTNTTYLCRLAINPANHNSIIAVGSDGIHQSLDGGTTWTNRRGVNCKDVKFNSKNPAIVYASGGNGYFRSTDSGSTWTSITTGLPTSIDRASIGTTTASGTCVYLLFSNVSFAGFYRSTDAGRTWTNMNASPINILGYDVNGNDTRGQGWYTLSIAVSPLDSNEVYVGGVNIWKSADGGANWNCQTDQSGGGSLPYVHADIHELRYSDNGLEIFAGTDGGAYVSNDAGNSWGYISDGMQNTQMYHISVSNQDSTVLMYGAQDNDVVVYNNGVWNGHNLHADGFEVGIDPHNSMVLYGESQYGGINQSIDGGASFQWLNVGQRGNWNTPFLLNPNVQDEVFIGLQNFYSTTNAGAGWNQLGTLGTSGNNFHTFNFSPSNPQIMYASGIGNSGIVPGLYKTTNGGTAWVRLSPTGLPNVPITSIEVHPTDANRLWVTSGGYGAGRKVYYSTDGGATFTNISGTLPNLPANTIVYQKNSADVLYVGMDAGVYVRDSSMSDWQLFNTNLPNVIVDELEIRYLTNEIFAGTYGRGLWKSKLYQQSYSVNIANDPILAMNFSLYPNPVSGILTVRFNNPSERNIQLNITDITGKKIIEVETKEASQATVSCGELPSGVYLVELISNGNKRVEKLVKL